MIYQLVGEGVELCELFFVLDEVVHEDVEIVDQPLNVVKILAVVLTCSNCQLGVDQVHHLLLVSHVLKWKKENV